MLLIIIWYFFHNIFGLDLGLGLVAMASASRFRTRLTSPDTRDNSVVRQLFARTWKLVE